MSGKFVHSAEIRWFLPEQGRRDQFLEPFKLGGRLPCFEEDTSYVMKPEADPFVKKEKIAWTSTYSSPIQTLSVLNGTRANWR